MQVYGNKTEIHSHVCNSILRYAALTTYLLKIICGKSFGCSFQTNTFVYLFAFAHHTMWFYTSFKFKEAPSIFTILFSMCFFLSFFFLIYVEFVVLHFVFVRVLLRNNGSLNLKRVKTRQSCYSPGMFCKSTKRS